MSGDTAGLQAAIYDNTITEYKIYEFCEGHPWVKPIHERIRDHNYYVANGTSRQNVFASRSKSLLVNETPVVENICLPVMEVMISKICARQPVPEARVFDSAGGYYSVNKTRIYNSIMNSKYKLENIRKEYKTAAKNWFTGGIGIFQVVELHRSPFENDDNRMDEIGEKIEINESGGKEDTDIESIFINVSPTEYFPDPAARCPEECRFVVIRRTVPRLSIVELYTDKKDKIMISGASQEQRGGNFNDDLIYFYEMYSLKTRGLKNGVHIFAVDGGILNREDWTLAMPLKYFYTGWTENRFWPIIPMSGVATYQDRVNRNETTIDINMAISNAVRIMYNEGTVSKTDLLSTNSCLIPYRKINPGDQQPQFWQGRGADQFQVARSQELKIRGMESLGLSNTSTGSSMGVRSGTTASMYQEMQDQELSALYNIISSFDDFIISTTQCLFEHIQHFMTEDIQRSVRYSDDYSGKLIEDQFTAEDLRAIQVDWQVQSGTTVGMSRSQAIQLAINYFKSGLLQTREEVFQCIENYGDVSKIIKTSMAHVQKAQKNLEDLVDEGRMLVTQKEEESNPQAIDQMIPGMITKYDNLDVHIKVFTDFTLLEKYRGLAGIIAARVIKYLDYCDKLKTQEMMKQQQLTMQMQQNAGGGNINNDILSQQSNKNQALDNLSLSPGRGAENNPGQNVMGLDQGQVLSQGA